jgi:lysophospholipase L1-like esterase
LKRLIIFGDSISTKSHGEGGYIRWLQERSDFDHVQSYAISASGLTDLTPNHMQKQILMHQEDIKRATHVLIWHGTNDYYYHVPRDEFEKQFIHIYHQLQELNPRLDIVCLTPILRFQALDQSSVAMNGFDSPNRAGYTLFDLEGLIIDLSSRLSISCINMRESTPFSMDNIDMYYEDRVHPNSLGYLEIIKPILNYYHIKGE